MEPLRKQDEASQNQPPLRVVTHDEKRMELTEHLGELRTRLIRSILYLVVGAILAYQIFTPAYKALYRPLDVEMQRQNKMNNNVVNLYKLESQIATGNAPTMEEFNRLVRDVHKLFENPPTKPIYAIVFKSFHEPFLIRLKLSIIMGFILVMPFIIWELGLFIAPALTPQERRPMRILIPLSTLLATFGVSVAYITMFFAMRWFLSYLSDFPQPNSLMQDPNDYILFFVKMMAAFALAFQLPVILMGGAFLGLITSKGLIKHWRWGVMIAALGGLFTPSNDIISMAMLSFPLLFLYFFSVLLVKFVERLKARDKRKNAGK